MKHLPGLNGVRAICVLAVVWHHSRPAGVGHALAGNGFLGVDIFFVLSGFLITALLLEERQIQGDISLHGFYWRRFLRIFPVYFAVLALLTVYYQFAREAGQRATFVAELPIHLLFLSNWLPVSGVMGVGWSLSTEEQFYLVWPPLVALMGRRSFWLLVVFLIVNQAVNFGAIGFGTSRNITQVTFTPIVLGSMLAFGLRSRAVRAWIEASTLSWRLYLVLGLLVAVASHPGDMQGAPRLCFHLLAAWFLAGVVTRPASTLVRLLEWRPLAYIGTVSYGVYLLHEIVLDRVGRVLASVQLGDAWRFPACALMTVIVAHLSYRFLEQPLLQLKTLRLMPKRRKAMPWPETR